MKSREAIRNKLLNYANIVWDTKRVDNIHPLVYLMIEELCNELYLMDDKLHNIDSSILEKLVQNILPLHFNYVKASSAVAHVRPVRNKLYLHRKTEFFVKELPSYLSQKYIDSVVFTPATDIILYNIGISSIIYNQKIWEVDDLGNKTLLGTTPTPALGNKMWLQLSSGEGLRKIENLCFYFDFQHHNDNHHYYQSFPMLKWKIGNELLKVEGGLPQISREKTTACENEALEYYKIHYQHLKDVLQVDNKALQKIPADLNSLLDSEQINNLGEGIWLSIEFPSHFKTADVEDLQILLNSFPVLNRRNVAYRQGVDDLMKSVALPSEICEEFLELESVQDIHKYYYSQDDGSSGKSRKGTFLLEAVKKKAIHDTRLHDYLELFADVLERERGFFAKVDKDKLVEIQNMVASLQQSDEEKIDLNILNDYAEVGHLTISPNEEAEAITVDYWTTLGSILNELPVLTQLMAGKITSLNKSETTLVSSPMGGNILYELESLKAINRFYMTSKGRILTKHDILSFCWIQLWKYAHDIDVVRCGKISPVPGQGIINVMDIRITPKVDGYKYFEQKHVLRQLKLQLEERSPMHYNYTITIDDNNN